MSKIGIVVPILNNFKGFAELVESAKSEDHEILWYVQPQHRHQVPLAAAWNKGFMDAVKDGCKYVAILNDDILLSPKTLDNMVDSFFILPRDVVLVSANNVYGNLKDPYDILHFKEVDSKDSSYSENPNYSCFMVKRDFFDKVGSFDENFVMAYFEDNDSHKRILELGFKAVTTTYASCVHYGSVTVAIDPSHANSQRSREYYIEKWGGLPYSHPVAEELKETFTHPYNNKYLTPKEWIPNYE